MRYIAFFFSFPVFSKSGYAHTYIAYPLGLATLIIDHWLSYWTL